MLKKVNNVESRTELSLWNHIPSEKRSFSLFMSPIRLTSALLPLCNIEETERGTEGRDSHTGHHPTMRWHSFPFMSLPSLLQMEKSNLYKAWRMKQFFLSPETEPQRWNFSRPSLMMPECASVYTCATTCERCDLCRRREGSELDLSVFWFDLDGKQAREGNVTGKHMSSSIWRTGKRGT